MLVDGLLHKHHIMLYTLYLDHYTIDTYRCRWIPFDDTRQIGQTAALHDDLRVVARVKQRCVRCAELILGTTASAAAAARGHFAIICVSCIRMSEGGRGVVNITWNVI